MPLVESDRLESWKEIATFLDRDVRTAMRYADRGMPVHRIPGGKKGRVFAYRGEIGAWLRSAGTADAGMPNASVVQVQDSDTEISMPGTGRSIPWYRSSYARLLLPGLLMVGLVAAVLYSRASSRPSTPVRVHVALDSVQAFGADGKELWRYHFSEPLDSELEFSYESLDQYVRIANVTGDKDKEILIVTPRRQSTNNDVAAQHQLDCFSSQGNLLWSYVPRFDYRFGNHDLKGPWHIFDVFITSDSRPRIWVTASHTVWGNAIVAEVDPDTGQGTTRFVNTGIVYRINEVQTAQGRYLLAAGWNNEYDGGSLAVIDERKPFAVSPQTIGTRHQCLDCGTGDPDQYVSFPRSELNKLLGSYEDPLAAIMVEQDHITLRKFATRNAKPSNYAHLLYEFRLGSALELQSLRFDSNYDMLHQKATAEGKLRHAIKDCPERVHPQPVRVWTPAKGWSELSVPAGFQ